MSAQGPRALSQQLNVYAFLPPTTIAEHPKTGGSINPPLVANVLYVCKGVEENRAKLRRRSSAEPLPLTSPENMNYIRKVWKVSFSRRNICGHMPETEGEGITGEGNRPQETGHSPRSIPGTHSLLAGQGRWVSKKPLKFFHSEPRKKIVGWVKL